MLFVLYLLMIEVIVLCVFWNILLVLEDIEFIVIIRLILGIIGGIKYGRKRNKYDFLIKLL